MKTDAVFDWARGRNAELALIAGSQVLVLAGRLHVQAMGQELAGQLWLAQWHVQEGQAWRAPATAHYRIEARSALRWALETPIPSLARWAAKLLTWPRVRFLQNRSQD